jgi:uncharacterized SAM-binding protein YcdF (DUF218 family)
MQFVVANMLWFLAQPSSLIWLALAAGLVLQARTRFERLGRRLAVIGVALLVVGGLSPLANLLLLPLEQRFPQPVIAPDRGTFAGIIVLGGAEDGRISAARGQLALNEAGERIAQAVVLARRLPSARLVFTGGAGSVLREERPGSQSVAGYWQAVGIEAGRIVIEPASLTTHENAVLTRKLLRPKPNERWLLVTSAAHMPRAMGLFRKAGFDVTAYPVDYRTKDAGDALRPFNGIARGLQRLDDGVREWASLLVHWMMGRIDALFPAP